MKFSSISVVRSSASTLILAATVFLGTSGIALAQGQAKENPADYTDKADPIKGQTGESTGSSAEKSKEGTTRRAQKDKYYGMSKEKEEMDTGYVDQKKRVERNVDSRSPSPDSHVPEFQKDKQGRPMKDPKEEQGGPIGPN